MLTGPPIWVIRTELAKWSASRGSVSMNRVSPPSLGQNDPAR